MLRCTVARAATSPRRWGRRGWCTATYRLDNVTLSPAGRVRVVLDWKLCTLSDPLAAVVADAAASSIMAS